MPNLDVKEVFAAYDEEGDGLIDAFDAGDVCRAAGLKPTNAMVTKAAGKKYEKGEKRLKLEEFMPIYEALKKEKPVGTYNDFCEGLKVFDQEAKGKIILFELQHVVQAVGERLTKAQAEEITEGVGDSDDMVAYEAFIKKVMAGPFPEEDE